MLIEFWPFYRRVNQYLAILHAICKKKRVWCILVFHSGATVTNPSPDGPLVVAERTSFVVAAHSDTALQRRMQSDHNDRITDSRCDSRPLELNETFCGIRVKLNHSNPQLGDASFISESSWQQTPLVLYPKTRYLSYKADCSLGRTKELPMSNAMEHSRWRWWTLCVVYSEEKLFLFWIRWCILHLTTIVTASPSGLTSANQIKRV